MNITAKKGDNGFTDHVRKDDSRIECLGTLDELDAFLSLCEIMLKSEGNAAFADITKEAREVLFTVIMPVFVRSFLSDKNELPGETKKNALNTARLDHYITELEKENPARGFVRTWTKPAAAYLNTARTICRRCERRMVAVAAINTPEIDNASKTNKAALLSWINRLSDLLFLLALAEEQWYSKIS